MVVEAPEWFQEALALKPTSHAVEVDGVQIAYLRFGEHDPTKRGLLL
jgi:hypothetical protein